MKNAREAITCALLANVRDSTADDGAEEYVYNRKSNSLPRLAPRYTHLVEGCECVHNVTLDVFSDGHVTNLCD